MTNKQIPWGKERVLHFESQLNGALPIVGRCPNEACYCGFVWVNWANGKCHRCEARIKRINKQ